ncbi:MAG: hypothetical protein IPK79_06050 [Vampirovibrionales bacterium]|nr:hypothetical protein [Vampirovibrionales bacterium]
MNVPFRSNFALSAKLLKSGNNIGQLIMSNPQITFRKNMNIGDQAAETDEFLSECFIETPEYEELVDFSNNKMILLGRTGSGKTALLRKIKESSDISICIRPETFALEYILNVPFLDRLKKEGINFDAFYKFLWLHEITSKIIKSYFFDEGEGFSLERFINHLSHGRPSEKIKKIKNYLSKYNGIWFSEEFPEKVTTEIQAGLDSKAAIMNFLTSSADLSSSERREIQTAASSYVNKEQLKHLENIVEILAAHFKENFQKKIVVLVDDLDQDWIDEDAKYKLINALMTSIRTFSDIPNLKIIIALRSDLHYKTCLLSNRQVEKDDAFIIKLNWSALRLTDMLDTRINRLFERQYSRRQSVKFNDIFNVSIEGKSAHTYILERSMMRPRDVIDFVNNCIIEADSSSKIEAKHIIAAEENFRSRRMQALSHEWKNVYHNLEGYFISVSDIGNEFTTQNLLNEFKTIERHIMAKSTDDDYMQDIFSSPHKSDDYKIKELIKVLFKVGFIGKCANDGSIHFESALKTDVIDLDLKNETLWSVHPLFRTEYIKV